MGQAVSAKRRTWQNRCGGRGRTPRLPEIDYISPTVVPLTPKERKALSLSDDWARQNIAPVLSGGGKVVYVHGASLPTIVATPMQVSDVELEAGELINEIVVGDSARWMVESGSAGFGPDAKVHLFIKPVDAGLESSTVITTNRRVYHLRLVSQRKGHTPYVGFLYADSLNRQSAARQAKEAREQTWNSTTIDGQQADLSKLNFNYEVKGKAAWKPERVYDNGRQTFIRLPGKTASGEMPVLLVRKGSRDVLVNYRVKDTAMIVDGLFERSALIVGGTVIRKKWKSSGGKNDAYLYPPFAVHGVAGFGLRSSWFSRFLLRATAGRRCGIGHCR